MQDCRGPCFARVTPSTLQFGTANCLESQPGVLTLRCSACVQYQHNRQAIAQSVAGPCGPQNGPLVGAEACSDECTLSKLPGAVPVAYKVTYTPPPEPSQVRAMLISMCSIHNASKAVSCLCELRARRARVSQACRSRPVTHVEATQKL